MSTSANPTMTITPSAGNTNDNSNPQQGTRSNTPPSTSGAPVVLQEKKIVFEKELSNTMEGEEGNGAATELAPTKFSPTKKDHRKLFVGGLPQDVTEAEFYEFFRQFGVIVDSVVMWDRETGRSRGFGFVTYDDPKVASQLLSMGQEEGADPSSVQEPQVGRLVMRGKTCEVKAAEPKEGSRNNRRGPGRRQQKNAGLSFQHLTPDPVSAAGHYGPAYMAAPATGPTYPMYAPCYYPAYQHGVYGGAASYVASPAPMYSYPPVSPTMPAQVPMSFPIDSPPMYGVPYAPPMDETMYPAHPLPGVGCGIEGPVPPDTPAMLNVAPGFPVREESE